MASSIIIDTQSNQPWIPRAAWDGRFPGRGQIYRFGLILQVDTEVKRISLLSLLNPLDLIRIAWKEYWTVEPARHLLGNAGCRSDFVFYREMFQVFLNGAGRDDTRLNVAIGEDLAKLASGQFSNSDFLVYHRRFPEKEGA